MRLDSRRQDGVFVRMTRVALLSLALLQLTLAAIPHAHAIEPSSDAPRAWQAQEAAGPHGSGHATVECIGCRSVGADLDFPQTRAAGVAEPGRSLRPLRAEASALPSRFLAARFARGPPVSR